ncbi:MAG: hypothetical protein WDZ74_00305 [Candidatus Paceibacterota bacterium]
MTQKEIPKQIKDELFFTFKTFYTKTKIKNIAERYNFTEKIEAFSKIVEETLYGERPVGELSKSLVDEIGVSGEVAEYIEIELDQIIFSQCRPEFNVAQGFVSPDEIVSTNKEGALSPATEDTEVNEETPKKVTSDPIASSLLGDNRRPGAQSDPYREPIDEE